MRVLVCGGRDYIDHKTVYSVLDQLLPRPALIIDGGARGADKLARDWAESRGVASVTYWANWCGDGYKAGGPIRNQRMLREAKPDLVLAFPGGRGTENMIGQAEAKEIQVKRVPA